MKLLFCEDCGDIVAPLRAPLKPRYCVCGRHAVWWVDPRSGVLRACDTQGLQGAHAGWPRVARAWILGITNLFLQFPGTADADDAQAIIDAHDDTYLFKQRRSPIIRIRPGDSGDTRWAALPEP